MTVYILRGLVLPERAQLSLPPIKVKFMHPSTVHEGEIKLSIVLNQITLWVYSESEWNIFDLRNVGKQFASDILSIIGFLKGYAYDIEIRHVINDEKEIDYVYGIDIPCIEKRNEHILVEEKLNDLLPKTVGAGGIYVKRCLNDLIMAMKHPEDTGFYCFRAIEALKQYCKNIFNIEKESEQWKKVTEITGYEKDYIEIVKKFAFPTRHGEVLPITSADREEIFMKTWDVIESFLEKMQ